MPGEQHEGYLCANVPIMRRNAAALIAPCRDPAPPLPPPSKDLEVVKTASTGAMWAVDAKLAAVRATVAGGRVTHQPGSRGCYCRPSRGYA